MFKVPFRNKSKPPIRMNIIVSDQMGWEHVSINLPAKNRTPSWEEMNFVKDLFWSDDDVVIQFHPKKEDYVNNHSSVLHLWRSKEQTIITPPSIMVGVKELNPEQVAKMFAPVGQAN